MNVFKVLLSFFFLIVSFHFYAADYFWVGNSGNWSDFSNHWATTSGGGIMHNSAPTINDDVYFDLNSFTANSQSVTLDLNIQTVNNVDLTGVTNTPELISGAGNRLDVNGDWIGSLNYNNQLFGEIHFVSGSSTNINSFGVFFNGDIIFDGFGTWELLSDFNSNSKLIITTGTINSNNFNIECQKIKIDGFEPRSLDAGTSNITITGADSAFAASPINLYLTLTNADLIFNNSSINRVEFYSGGASINYPKVSVSSTIFELKEPSTIVEFNAVPGSKIYLPVNNTSTITTFNIDGTCALPTILTSSSTDTLATLSIAGGTTCNYLHLQDIQTGGGVFTANNSIDNGNNPGWTINEINSNGNVYWIGNTGNWSNPTNWSTNCLPGPNDTIVFNGSSFSGVNDVVTLDVDAYGYSMKWVGVTGTPDFTGTAYTLNLKESILLDPNMTSSFSGSIYLFGTDNSTITSNGVALNNSLVLNKQSGCTLLDTYSSTNGIELLRGSIDFGNFSHTIKNFLSKDNTYTRTIDLSTSSIFLNGIDEVLVLESPNLVVNTTSSTIEFNNLTNANFSFFKSDLINYDTVVIGNVSTHLYGSNSFKYLKVKGGSEFLMEGGTEQSIDSLTVESTCISPSIIGAVSTIGMPATINKTGYDTLTLNNVTLNHVDANILSGAYYELNNGILLNTTTNWVDNNSLVGASFYWRGNSGNWNDVSKWESPLGTPALCLPTIKDSVYFDGSSFTLPNQIVNINIPANAKLMDWSGSGVFSPTLIFENSLNIKNDLITDLGVNYLSSTTFPSVNFIPNGNKSLFTTNGVLFDVNVTVDGNVLADTLELNGTLRLGNDKALNIYKGSFLSNNDSIFVGILNSNSIASQYADLGSSYIEVFSNFDARGTGVLDFSNSEIHFANGSSFSEFYGGDRVFNTVTLYGSQTSIIRFYNSNTINYLEIKQGSRIQFESGETQTITTSFVAKGNCVNDSIFLSSITVNSPSIINSTIPSTIEVCNLTDITGSGISVLFGADAGGNTGINFLATLPVTSGFNHSFENCYGTPAVFTNTSIDYLSGTALTYEWDFGDGYTSTLTNPSHSYNTSDLFKLTLKSTYTNGCYTIYEDSIRVNDASIVLASSDIDSTICAGDMVNFSVTSAGASNYNFFLNTNSVLNGTNTNYSNSNLVNGDSVWVQVTLNGCVKSSSAIPFVVHNLPTTSLISSDADNIICDGESVTFTASGADVYLFFIDGVQQGSYSTSNTLTTTTIQNNETISVRGKDTITDCIFDAPVSYNFTVNVNPIPTVIVDDADLVICQSDMVTFTASGANEYEFFVNGVSQQGSNTQNTWSSTSLNQSDVVTVVGTSLGCSTLSADSSFWYVNPIPNVILTNNSIGNNICNGSSIQFTSSGASSYEFFKNGTSVQGPNGSVNYTDNTVSSGDTYYVEGEQNGCTGTSVITTITLTPLPIVSLTSSFTGSNICSTDTVDFIATGASNYIYYNNGIPISGNFSSGLYSTSDLSSGEVISVEGTSNNCSSFSSSTFSYIVEPPINLNFSYTNGLDSICNGTPLSFSGVGLGVTQYNLVVNGSIFISNSTGNFNNVILNNGNNLITLAGIRNGCEGIATSSFSVYVKSLPNITLASSDLDNVLCSNDSVIVSATGGIEYEFFIDGFTQGLMSTVDSLTLNGLQNGSVVSVVGQVNGCTSAANNTQVFTVNTVPTVTLTSSDVDNIICENEQITFTVFGANEYIFNLNSLPISNYSTLNTYLTDSLQNGQTISVIGKSNACLSQEQFLSITINPLPIPTIATSSLDTVSCEGELVSFNGSGANLYEYFIDNVSTGAPSINSNFSTTQLINNQTITMIGTSANGCVANSSDTLTFIIKPLPVLIFNSAPLNDTICNADNISFSISGADSINFYLNGVFELTNPTYSSNTIQNGDIITINGYLNGCKSLVDSNYQFIVLNYPNTQLSSLDDDLIICDGDSIAFTSFGATNFEFFIDNVSQGFTQNDTTTFYGVSNGQEVSVLGYNFQCVSSSDTLQISVNQVPSTTITSSVSNNEICFGETVVFNTAGANNYELYINNNLQNITNINNSYSVDFIENGDLIYVLGNNGDCHLNSDSLTFIVHTMNLNLTNNSNNMICEGEVVTFTGSGADNYEFFINGVSVQASSSNNSYIASNLQDGDVVTMSGFSTTTNCTQILQDEHLFVVLNIPTISPVGPITSCAGEEVLLSCDYINWNQWSINTNDILGANEDTYNVDSSGSYQTAIQLGGNNELTSFGNNTYGQLGDNTLVSSLVTTPVFDFNNVDEIESGKDFSLALNNAGELFAWGRNEFGQLGDSTYGHKIKPQFILDDIIVIDAGEKFSVVVDENKTVLAWGNNDYGQLGDGLTATRNVPLIVNGLNNIVTVKAGQGHVMALNAIGQVFTWGDNQYGQLGQGNLISNGTPTQINLPGIAQIAVGSNHSFAIDSVGNTYAWGNNAEGQLGNGTLVFESSPVLINIDNLKLIDGGKNHSIAITNDNELYTWGANSNGQLGNGTITTEVLPIKIGSLGSVNYAEAGYHNSFVVRSDNSVWSFGKNTNGQLGDLTLIDKHIPTHIREVTGSSDFGLSNSHTTVLATEQTSCYSNIVEVNLLEANEVSIIELDTILFASETGVYYQWYFYGNPITTNGNNQSYVPQNPGEYSVIVTYANGCEVESDEHPYNLVGYKENLNNLLKLYPNPSNGIVNVDYTGANSINLEVYNSLGVIVEKQTIKNSRQLNVSSLSNGIYYAKFSNEKEIKVIRFEIIK